MSTNSGRALTYKSSRPMPNPPPDRNMDDLRERKGKNTYDDSGNEHVGVNVQDNQANAAKALKAARARMIPRTKLR